MAKLRKMLGKIDSEECIALMRLIETQSKETLMKWTVDYAKEEYLPIYRKRCGEDVSLQEAVAACERYIKGEETLKEVKPVLKEAVQTARDAKEDSIVQAAARAVSTACFVIQTPTNALGFLFYGAAAKAYDHAGLEEKMEVYDQLAEEELKHAYDSLKISAVEDEPNPVKINWNC